MRRTNCLKSRIRMTCCLENKFDYNAGTCLRHVSSALTAFGEKPNPVGTWYFTSAHNCDTILNINHLTRTRSIAFLPCKIGRFDTTSFRNHFIIRGFSPCNGERFLFLIPTTIPATMYNHCHSNFPLSLNDRFWITYCYPTTLPNNSNGVASVISTW